MIEYILYHFPVSTVYTHYIHHRFLLNTNTAIGIEPFVVYINPSLLNTTQFKVVELIPTCLFTVHECYTAQTNSKQIVNIKPVLFVNCFSNFFRMCELWPLFGCPVFLFSVRCSYVSTQKDKCDKEIIYSIIYIEVNWYNIHI